MSAVARSRTDRPNVVVLIFDSLRPDPLSVYGGGVETAAFERAAASGTLFERAYACAPGTPVSHAALFSGQYPSTSGVDRQKQIPTDVPMLAAHLSEHGYDTLGIPGPSRMGSMWGYDRGFDEYYETYLDDHPDYRSPGSLAKHVVARDDRALLVSDFLRTLTRGYDSHTRFKFDFLKRKAETSLSSPFYAVLNTTIVHQPWRPPRPYMRAETPELNRPRYHLFEYVLENTLSIDRDDVRMDRLLHCDTPAGMAMILNDPSYLNEAELDVLWSWYEACIRYLDARLDEFLTWFEASRLADDTLLILTADHGEFFLEHDLWTHSYGLYDEVLRVPFLIRGPDVPAGERVEEFVSLVDVFPTVCDLTGIEPPETDGISMFGERTRDAVFAEYGPSAVGETHMDALDDPDEERARELRLGQKGIRTDEYLYVYRSDGTDAVYSRPDESPVQDPDESTRRRLRNRLASTLGLEFGGVEADPYADVSDAVRENLKTLGYID